MNTKTLLAGGTGGASMVLVGHPLDTVKVRIQNDLGGKYGGIGDCVRKVVRSEGPAALWKGMSLPLGATSSVFALCFYGYNHGKTVFCDADAFDPDNLKLPQIFAAGAFSSFYTTPVQAPQELLKCRIQQSATPLSVRDAIAAAYRDGGARSLTRGFSITWARDASASAFYFGIYELMKATLRDVPGLSRDGAVNGAGVLVAGAVSGVFNWLPAIPLDNLKTQYQVAPEGAYTGAIIGERSVVRDGVRDAPGERSRSAIVPRGPG